MRFALMMLGVAIVAACQPVDREGTDRATAFRDTVWHTPAPAPPGAPAGVQQVAVVEGFLTPESVLHDAAQDIYFVSNINGRPTNKDNNGFISRVKPDGAVENLRFIEGGRNDVTLHAPKGLAVVADTLWVTDIDVVRAFDAKSGAPLDSVSLTEQGAVFLNDIAVATTGALYVTDTGIRFDDVGNVLHPGPDRVFRIGVDRTVTVPVKGDSAGFGGPNGIALDSLGKRFVIVPFQAKTILAWRPGDEAPSVVDSGAGGFDGVEIVGGKIFASSWADSSVTRFDSAQSTRVITGIPTPADFGYDARRNRLLIPVLSGNRVEIWQLQ